MDSLLRSLLRGRVLATVASSAIVGTSTASMMTDSVNEWVLTANAILALVSALAAIASKLRELRGK